MHTRTPRAQVGFTYFMLLWWVALSGVALAALSHNWTFERRREKEIEMVARAEEIRAAIASYRLNVPGGQVGAWPPNLQDLVEDKRGPRTVRHLRRLWTDPLTGRADWGLVKDQPVAAGGAGSASVQVSPGAEGGIHGVYSMAKGLPIRGPAGIKGYEEWRFDASAQTNGP